MHRYASYESTSRIPTLPTDKKGARLKKAPITLVLLLLGTLSICAIVSLAYSGTRAVGRVNEAWNVVYVTDEPMAHTLTKISNAITDLRLQDQTILVDYDAAYLKKQLSDMGAAQKAIDDHFAQWNAIPNKDAEAQAAFARFAAEYEKWSEQHAEYVALATQALQSKDKGVHNAARDLSRGRLRDTRKVMEGELAATDELVQAGLVKRREQIAALEKRATAGFVTLALVGVLITAVIGIAVLVSIRTSLREGVAYAEAVERGEFDATIEHPGNEVGTLTHAIENMKLSLVAKMTGMQEMERTLLESEERFRAVFEGAADGIFLLAPDGTIKFVNAAMAEMHGYTTEEMLAMDLADLDTPETARLAPERLRRVFAGESMTFEVEHFCKNGQLVPIEVTANLVDAGGETYVLGFHRDISERKQAEARLAQSLSSIIEVVGQVVEMRDPYTAGHERRVSELAMRIAEEMGLPADQIEAIRIAALIHDVGKMSVPAEILSRPGELTPMEFDLIKEHAEAGYRILASANMEAPISEMVYQHHERCDGSGYPRGLLEGELLVGAKVLAVADVVEAMSSHRPYRAAVGVAPALAEIERGAGKQFDAVVVESCLRVFREQGFSFSEE
jgi:PAS domain S-box-containing protein/putative nucleotidyltransferase with HDIG domain